MDVASLTGWVFVSVLASICAAARVRRACLQSHAASLRDRDEYSYVRLIPRP